MTNPFQHPKIRKYFYCGHDFPCPRICDGLDYKSIVNAMCEPIKKGERFLFWSVDHIGEWVEMKHAQDTDTFHGYKLRLPNRFQPQKVDLLDKSITSLMDTLQDALGGKRVIVEDKLRELIALVEARPDTKPTEKP